jgi:hypothetical protein
VKPVNEEISTARWAVASFVAAIGALALLSVPLAAVSAGTGSSAFGQALLVAFLVAVAAAVIVTIALDLLGARTARSRRTTMRTWPPRSPSPPKSSSGTAAS